MKIRAAIALKWMELEGGMVWERWEMRGRVAKSGATSRKLTKA